MRMPSQVSPQQLGKLDGASVSHPVQELLPVGVVCPFCSKWLVPSAETQSEWRTPPRELLIVCGWPRDTQVLWQLLGCQSEMPVGRCSFSAGCCCEREKNRSSLSLSLSLSLSPSASFVLICGA